MKTSYPNYRNTTLKEVKEQFSLENQKLIHDFLNYCEITACKSSLQKIESKIIQICDVLEKSLSDLNLLDVREYLRLLNTSGRAKETKNDLKKILKRFLRWHYSDWSQRFDNLKDIRTENGFNHEKINSSTLLTQDEIGKMIQGADSIRNRALIVLMAESAARPEEIRNLTWKKIRFRESSVDVTFFSSKTKRSRVLPLKESALHLKRWRVEYPFGTPFPDDLVFPSPRKRGKPVSGETISGYVKRLGKKTIGRPVFPYLFRHSVLTRIYKSVSTQVGAKFAGHSVDMSTRYTHLSNDDLRQEMFAKVFKVDPVDDCKENETEKLRAELSALKREYRDELKLIREKLKKIEGSWLTPLD